MTILEDEDEDESGGLNPGESSETIINPSEEILEIM
jgi:hypothetical protein